ncbi:MAG TPA: FtsX-like permease family protein [Candidatus Hydrogenedentes bacterium]|nr:FtsX-like permease family protein [Candidatus Hydrogenedentota bacterium]HPG69352.1 FtsX-like permease family protein [Candidatus Hydrogenedentota bacterium]
MRLSTLQIAYRNLGRNKRRTLLALSAIALGQFTLVFVNAMMAGSFETMIKTVTGPLIGHVQVHHRAWREERAVDLYIDNVAESQRAIEALPGVTAVSTRTYAPVLAASGETGNAPADAEPAVVVGLNVANEARTGGLLGPLPEENLPGAHGVALGKALAIRLGLERGDQIAIIAQDADGFPTSDLFEVRAVVDSTVDIVKTMGILMSAADAGELLAMPDKAHELIIQGEDYREADILTAEVAALPELQANEVISWREAMPEIVRMMDMKNWVDVIFLAIVFVAAAAGVANTSLMSTFERTKEFGMLLAMGTNPGRIVRMVLIESVTLGLIGVMAGSILGLTAVFITSQTGLDYSAFSGIEAEDISFAGVSFSYIIYPHLEARHVTFGIVAVVITSVLASLWPAVLAARLEPVEAMHS